MTRFLNKRGGNRRAGGTASFKGADVGSLADRKRARLLMIERMSKSLGDIGARSSVRASSVRAAAIFY